MSETKAYIDEEAIISDNEITLTITLFSGDENVKEPLHWGVAAGPVLNGFDKYRDSKEYYTVVPVVDDKNIVRE